ncbi:hypothetical protein HY994_01005 [Candidatus Micrarchaeota archaeon]|nr:hypothetical protein [Candidatus Micrarchaeota archaeon]
MWNRITRFLARFQSPELLESSPLDLEPFLHQSIGKVVLTPAIHGQGRHFSVGVDLSSVSKNPGWFGHPRSIFHVFEPREFEIDGYFNDVPGQWAARDEMFEKAHPFLKMAYRRAHEMKPLIEESGRPAEVMLDQKLADHLKKRNLKLT